jgi:hypothetical protein
MDRLGTKGGESALEKEIPLGRQGKVSWSQCSLAVCVVGQMADQLLPLTDDGHCFHGGLLVLGRRCVFVFAPIMHRVAWIFR